MKLTSLALLALISAASIGCEIHLGGSGSPADAPTALSAEPLDRARASITLETRAAFAGDIRAFEIDILETPNGDPVATSTLSATAPAGGVEDLVVGGLKPGVPAYFSIATIDDWGDRSLATVIGPVVTDFSFSGAILPPAHDDGDNALGYQLAYGDFNGDGNDDLAVSAPFKSVGDLDGAGSVYVYFGSERGLETDVGSTLEGTEAFAQFGNALAVVDWNGDGLDDLAVGAPFAAGGAGEVLVFSGATVASGAAQPMVSIASDNLGWFAGAAIGFTLTTSDLDGDGYTDLAIGAVAGGGGGGVLALFGGSDAMGELGLSDTAADIGDLAVARIESPSDGSLFGMTLEPAGALTRGSRLAISGFQTGSVIVMNGVAKTSPGTITDVAFSDGRDLEVTSDLEASAYFGASVASIDVDGSRELVIGAYRANGGDGLVAMVDLGRTGSIAIEDNATAMIKGTSGSQLGSAIANNGLASFGGDVDGDGEQDLVLVGGEGQVELLVWYGGALPAGETTAASAGHQFFAPIGMKGELPTIGGTPARAAWVGDVDGDGLEDLAWADWTGNGRDGLFEVLR